MDPALGLATRLARTVATALEAEGCDCLLFSGGVDTSFIALADRLHGLRLEAAVTVAPPWAPDYEYAVKAAGDLGLRLHTIDPSRVPGALWTAAEAAVAWLETVDPVEATSAAALLLALHEARSLGCRCVATGDGGDELFLGYQFLHGAPVEAVEEWRRVMESGGARFTAPLLGRLAGVRVAAPLYTREAALLASTAPTRLLLGPHEPGAPMGKAPLRLLLDLAGLGYVAGGVRRR